MTKNIRKVVIKNMFGEVELSSNRREDKLEILVPNALDLLKKLIPKKNGVTQEYVK